RYSYPQLAFKLPALAPGQTSIGTGGQNSIGANNQARLIRKKLAQTGFREVTVSTVHRTQGSAKKVVIFDVVDGRHPFLQTEEAKRLLTVAFSRAEAKLLVMASQRDLAHPILQMAEVAANLEAVKIQAAKTSNRSVA
ncbi:MAG: hypothetical protein EAZ11_13965, partial [Curvibacter sp.]